MAAEDQSDPGSRQMDALFLRRVAENAITTALANGGGGNDPPGMEEIIRRVDQLETDVRDVKASVGRLEATASRLETSAARIEAAVLKVGEALVKTREEVAELKGKVSQMPTAWQLLIGVVAIMGATFGILKAVLPPH